MFVGCYLPLNGVDAASGVNAPGQCERRVRRQFRSVQLTCQMIHGKLDGHIAKLDAGREELYLKTHGTSFSWGVGGSNCTSANVVQCDVVFDAHVDDLNSRLVLCQRSGKVRLQN